LIGCYRFSVKFKYFQLLLIAWLVLEKLLKTLKRTIILEGWTSSIGRQALREVGDAYREMLGEMTDYALEYRASQSTLHRIFYNRFREEYP
jgi:putative transposase